MYFHWVGPLRFHYAFQRLSCQILYKRRVHNIMDHTLQINLGINISQYTTYEITKNGKFQSPFTSHLTLLREHLRANTNPSRKGYHTWRPRESQWSLLTFIISLQHRFVMLPTFVCFSLWNDFFSNSNVTVLAIDGITRRKDGTKRGSDMVGI